MDCAKGKSGSVVEWTWMEEAPDADRICLSVTANEKISMGCAGSSVLASYHSNGRETGKSIYHCQRNPTRDIVLTEHRSHVRINEE